MYVYSFSMFVRDTDCIALFYSTADLSDSIVVIDIDFEMLLLLLLFLSLRLSFC